MQALQNQHSSDMHDIWHSTLEVKNAPAENSLTGLENLWKLYIWLSLIHRSA